MRHHSAACRLVTMLCVLSLGAAAQTNPTVDALTFLTLKVSSGPLRVERGPLRLVRGPFKRASVAQAPRVAGALVIRVSGGFETVVADPLHEDVEFSRAEGSLEHTQLTHAQREVLVRIPLDLSGHQVTVLQVQADGGLTRLAEFSF